MSNIDSSRFNMFEREINSYLPDRGEGETRAEQLVTAVNKIVYKFYNDGDVFDNTGYLDGWANDLSSYANWIYKYFPRTRPVLDGVFDCANEEEYEALLLELASVTLDPDDLEELDQKPVIGSIYDCSGPFQFVEDDDDDDGFVEYEDEETFEEEEEE